MDLDLLPPELFFNIFDFLCKYSLSQIRLVNKKYKKYIDDYIKYHKIISLKTKIYNLSYPINNVWGGFFYSSNNLWYYFGDKIYSIKENKPLISSGIFERFLCVKVYKGKIYTLSYGHFIKAWDGDFKGYKCLAFVQSKIPIVNFDIKNDKIYLSRYYSHIEIWSLTGDLIYSIKLPLSGGKLYLNGNGDTIYLVYQKQNRIFVYKDNLFYTRYDFRCNHLITCVEVRGDYLYVGFEDGYIYVYYKNKKLFHNKYLQCPIFGILPIDKNFYTYGYNSTKITLCNKNIKKIFTFDKFNPRAYALDKRNNLVVGNYYYFKD